MFPLKIDRYLFSKKNIEYLKTVIHKNDIEIYLMISTGGIFRSWLIPEYANINKLNRRICLKSNLAILITVEYL